MNNYKKNDQSQIGISGHLRPTRSYSYRKMFRLLVVLVFVNVVVLVFCMDSVNSAMLVFVGEVDAIGAKGITLV